MGFSLYDFVFNSNGSVAIYAKDKCYDGEVYYNNLTLDSCDYVKSCVEELFSESYDSKEFSCYPAHYWLVKFKDENKGGYYPLPKLNRHQSELIISKLPR